MATVNDPIYTAPMPSLLVAPTLAVTAALYAAGNNVGGLLTLTNAMRVSGGSGLLQSLVIADHANQKAPLDVLLFSAPPAATFADKAAFPTLSVADDALVLTRISLLATDYATIGGSAFVSLRGLGIVVAAAAAAQTLYAAINTSGTPTYAATTDLVAQFGFLRN